MKFGANQKMGCTELGGESIMQTWSPGSSLQKSLMSSNYLLTCSAQNQCFCFTDSKIIVPTNQAMWVMEQ